MSYFYRSQNRNMKKLLPTFILVIMVWGCAKKMTPAKSETPSSNTGSVINTQGDNNPGKSTGTTTSSSQVPVDNTGITGTKIADTKEKSPAETAAIAGQAIYNAKCSRCHGLKATIDYTADRWASILAVMAPRANLSETEKANVYAYVKANAKK